MTLTLYNTLTRKKEPFRPIDPANVRMYVCGPTVYDYAHIGNARPIIVFDVLYRLLRHLYGADHVTYVRNITDVEDKINARAAEEGISIRALTERTTKQFHADIAALGVLPPTHEPRATDHIEEMKTLCEALVAKGCAYVAEDHVLFHVASMPDYGRLSNRTLAEMEAGARVEVAPYKRDPTDFVLWKPSRRTSIGDAAGQKVDEPGWPSPCGIAAPGRPGWHIECSAMADKWLWEAAKDTLGAAGRARPHEFDIHGGGIDLVFPHHENEIAQSRCGFGTGAMANVWMHNGFLQVEGEKMSKSLGNFFTINDVLESKTFGAQKWHGRVFRLAMLTTHYRQPMDWTIDRLFEARSTLYNWNLLCFEAPETSEPVAELLEPLCDDLNTPASMGVLHALANSVHRAKTGPERVVTAQRLRAGLTLMGLYETQPSIDLLKQDVSKIDGAEIDTKIKARLAARRAKNFAEADRIRDELAAMGVALKDAKDHATGEITTTWEIAR